MLEKPFVKLIYTVFESFTGIEKLYIKNKIFT